MGKKSKDHQNVTTIIASSYTCFDIIVFRIQLIFAISYAIYTERADTHTKRNVMQRRCTLRFWYAMYVSFYSICDTLSQIIWAIFYVEICLVISN